MRRSSFLSTAFLFATVTACGKVANDSAGRGTGGGDEGASAGGTMEGSGGSPEEPDEPTSTGGTLGSVTRFRVANETDAPAYINGVAAPVACRDAAGDDCNFFPLPCIRACSDAEQAESCCIECEQPVPTMLVIPPGASRTFDWDAKLHQRRSGYCSMCDCAESAPAAADSYTAVVSAYAAYSCGVLPGSDCEEEPDVIRNAGPSGPGTEHQVTFALPTPDSEVVVEIKGD